MSWLMKAEEKNRILDLAIRQSEAYVTLVTSEKRVSPEELTKLKAAESEALKNLRKETIPLLTSVDHIKEFALHVRQEIIRRPVVKGTPVKKNGEWVEAHDCWNKQVASGLKNALQSLQAAFVAEFGSEKAREDSRVKVLMPRAYTASLFVQLFNALDGETPNSKDEYGEMIRFGLARLDLKIGALVNAKKNDEANRLIHLYKKVKGGFSELLKPKSEKLPPTAPPLNMEQALPEGTRQALNIVVTPAPTEPQKPEVIPAPKAENPKPANGGSKKPEAKATNQMGEKLKKGLGRPVTLSKGGKGK